MFINQPMFLASKLICILKFAGLKLEPVLGGNQTHKNRLHRLSGRFFGFMAMVLAKIKKDLVLVILQPRFSIFLDFFFKESTFKSILRQKKKNYENSNISPCKNIIFKKSSQRNQNPSKIYYNSIITNLKFQHKPKYIIFQKSLDKNRPIITQEPNNCLFVTQEFVI